MSPSTDGSRLRRSENVVHRFRSRRVSARPNTVATSVRSWLKMRRRFKRAGSGRREIAQAKFHKRCRKSPPLGQPCPFGPRRCLYPSSLLGDDRRGEEVVQAPDPSGAEESAPGLEVPPRQGKDESWDVGVLRRSDIVYGCGE